MVDEDFVLLADKLQSALKTMQTGSINIVAIHQRMTQDKPYYLFMHYWGSSAQDLAKTVKSAVDEISK